jgi:FkbM family methyltransferase
MNKQIYIGKHSYTITSDDNYLEAVGNDFEPHMVNLYRALITPEDVVADIGANIGLTAILFSNMAKKTFAFEPSPSTFNILSRNLASNHIKNVEVINLGLGKQEETLTITFAKNNRSGGYVSDKIRPETGHITEDIRIDTLDHFFSSSKNTPTFLKIDVEGFEKNVIKGGTTFLQRARPVVVMEMNHFCLDVLQRITIPDFLDYMRSVFPYLYAIDTDNSTIADLHVPDIAYMVMHEHVVKHRYPNLVGGFDSNLRKKLEVLENQITHEGSLGKRLTSIIINKLGAAATSFITPVLSKTSGNIVTNAASTSIQSDSTFEMDIRISNKSKETWYGYGLNPVYLSYHWKKINGDFHIYDGIRTEFSKPELIAGENVDQKIVIQAPRESGNYKLVLTLVQEGVCWFEDRGFEPATLNIEVF